MLFSQIRNRISQPYKMVAIITVLYMHIDLEFWKAASRFLNGIIKTILLIYSSPNFIMYSRIFFIIIYESLSSKRAQIGLF
jgi:hypothetical protein